MKTQVSVSEEGVLWSWSISADRVKCLPPQYKSTKSNSDDGQARSQAIFNACYRVTISLSFHVVRTKCSPRSSSHHQMTACLQIARLHCHLVFPLWPSCRCFSLSIYPQLIHQTGCMALTPGITSAHRLVNIYRPKLVFRPALQLFREKSTSQLDSTGWRISREPQDRMVLENVYTGRRNEEDGTHRICGISISTFPKSAINGFFQGNEDK